ADLPIVRVHAALGGSDVGAALNKLRGHADRDAGQLKIKRSGRQCEAAGLLVDERSDGVLVLSARLIHIDELSARGFKLRLRFGNCDFGGEAALEQALVEIDLMLIVGNRRREQAALRVE